MDQGGVYEEGTPEQIFENPQRENTRRFVQRLKVLELHIDSRDYDFLGMAGEIAQYCGKNQMAPKLTNRLGLIFEEFVQQQLMSVLEQPRIEVVVEYAQAEERSTLTVRYNGAHRDVTQEGDELSMALLKGMVTQMQYSERDDPQYPNQVVLELKS
jgi:polar amino acid transport system ATP-binding protein